MEHPIGLDQHHALTAQLPPGPDELFAPPLGAAGQVVGQVKSAMRTQAAQKLASVGQQVQLVRDGLADGINGALGRAAGTIDGIQTATDVHTMGVLARASNAIEGYGIALPEPEVLIAQGLLPIAPTQDPADNCKQVLAAIAQQLPAPVPSNGGNYQFWATTTPGTGFHPPEGYITTWPGSNPYGVFGCQLTVTCSQVPALLIALRAHGFTIYPLNFQVPDCPVPVLGPPPPPASPPVTPPASPPTVPVTSSPTCTPTCIPICPPVTPPPPPVELRPWLACQVDQPATSAVGVKPAGLAGSVGHSACPPGWPGDPPEGYCNCYLPNLGQYQQTTPDNCQAAGGTCWYGCPTGPTQTPPAMQPPLGSPPTTNGTSPPGRLTQDDSAGLACMQPTLGLPLPNIVNWCSLDICNNIEEVLSRWKVGSGSFDLGQILGMYDFAGKPTYPDWYGPAAEWTNPIYIAFDWGVRTLLNGFNVVVNALPASPDCNVPAFSAVTALRAITGLAQKYLGSAFDDINTTLSYYAGYLCPTLIPSAAQANAMFLANVIDENLWACYVRGNNFCEAPMAKVVESQRTRPGVGETAQLWLRDELDDKQTQSQLRALGVTVGSEQEQFLALTKQVPTTSQLIQYAARDVYDRETVKRYGLAGGMDITYLSWAKKTGWVYDLAPGAFGEDRPWLESWAHADWYAHWTLPGPTFAFDAIHRLRPTGGKGGGPRDPSGIVWNPEDTDYLLSAAQIPVPFRQAMVALSYRPANTRQVTNMVKFGLIDQAEAKEVFLDNGYQEPVAGQLARMVVAQVAEQEFRRLTSGAKGQILSAYKVGILARETAALGLYKLELGSAEAVANFEALAPGLQQQAALADGGVKVALDLADVQVAGKLSGEAIQGTRRLYLSGRITLDQAATRLTTIGITSNRQRQYLALWQLQLNPVRREIAAGSVLKLFREGLLNASSASARLLNLGYPQADIVLLLRDAQLQIEKDALKAEKTDQAGQDKQTAKHHKTLLASGSAGDIKRWMGEGLISLAEGISQLQALGYTREAAELYALEAEAKLKKKAGK